MEAEHASILANPHLWVNIALLVFIVVAGPKLWKALASVLDQRSLRIKNSLDEAQKLRDEAQALLNDPKDRAENLMIVDLMRNDLARVSRPGAVKVPALFALESYANVHHLVSTVTGVLLPGVGAADVLKAAFPPGSITGAPKVQAMKVIAGLEPPRGPYCGSLFWAGFDGGMDSNVLIRTSACVQDQDGWRIEAGAGAGIVADSDPHGERLETEAKFAAIHKALIGGPASGAGA